VQALDRGAGRVDLDQPGEHLGLGFRAENAQRLDGLAGRGPGGAHRCGDQMPQLGSLANLLAPRHPAAELVGRSPAQGPEVERTAAGHPGGMAYRVWIGPLDGAGQKLGRLAEGERTEAHHVGRVADERTR
jgi:hypothetical protein